MMQDQKQHKSSHICLIAIGANLPYNGNSPLQTLKNSLKLYPTEIMTVIKVSNWYSTPAYPKESGPDFVNAAIMVETSLSPNAVLDVLHSIEQELGRTRDNRWEPRICDLDIIAYDDIVSPSKEIFTKWKNLEFSEQKTETPEQLILPHPRMQDRSFVLTPLNDIAPDWVHPVIGLTVNEMLNALPETDRAEITRIEA